MRYERTSHHVIASASLLIACTLGALACGAGEGEQLGQLELGLTTEAEGVSYRLSNARFTLEGPERREIAAADEDELTLELPSGAYRLTLLEGFQLVRSDATGGAPPVPAMLVSQNPAPVLITAGQTARVTLRFALADGTRVETGRGTLAVSIAVGAADAGAESPECSSGLRINELDYEQESSDEAEFVEIVQTGSCPAALADVTLELVNGSDGRPYGRYALADASDSLAPGERLVLGDANVVAALPAEIKRLMLGGSGLQNGPDGLRLLRGEQVIDAVSYEATVSGSSEGGAAAADEGGLALSRCPDGFDTQDGALDFRLATPTPGGANACSEAAVAP
jgi:hypothetical protein